MIVEYVATRYGGDRLLGTEEFSQVASALAEVDSVGRVCVRNRPLLVLGCRSLVQQENDQPRPDKGGSAGLSKLQEARIST